MDTTTITKADLNDKNEYAAFDSLELAGSVVIEAGLGAARGGEAMTPVVAVMLADGRLEMALRALRSFQAQTYESKRLLIYETGTKPVTLPWHQDIQHFMQPRAEGQTIGELRNAANEHARKLGAAIIVHWDSDDWSAPDRIAEQVALLEASGGDGAGLVQCVGMNSMMFWREQEREAWLYSNPLPHYALGTSLCYWTDFWKRNPFTANRGEESEFAHWLQPGITWGGCPADLVIASIHAGNQHRNPYRRELMVANEAQGGEWRRATEHDERIAKIMELK